MPYFLGVDLGTAYTAAAIHRGGRTTTVELGDRTATIPSVVFLRDDDTILTGDAALRRGASEPERVAREFKRRVGDTTPLLLGGSPYSAEALMGQLLRGVVDAVAEREGEPPAALAVTYPANWGSYKQDLLRQAFARADLDDVATITEPEAAVTWYASQERIEPGSVIAVYDLGGGTFDAAVVRKTDDAVEVLGTPEGIERLGGIDFDEAVLAHVLASLGDAAAGLDPDDAATTAALVRLRSECVEAKEALSADTEVSIHVLLPGVTSEVRLTRSELEAMIRPPLADSITALRRALRSAEVDPADLRAVLLAGGSSRIPLVAQLVGGELGRPVAVDAHPKHGVALGAALTAARAAGEAPPPPPPPAPPGTRPAAESLAAAAAAAAAGAGVAAGAAGLAGARGGSGAGDLAGDRGAADTAETAEVAGYGSGAGAGAGPGPADPDATAPMAGGPGAGDPSVDAGAGRPLGPRVAEPEITAPMAGVAGQPGVSDTPPRGSGPPPGYAPEAATEVLSTSPPTQAWGPPGASGTGPGEAAFRPRGDGTGNRSRVLLLVVGAVVLVLVLAAGAAALLDGDDPDTTSTEDTTTTTAAEQTSITEPVTTTVPTSSSPETTARRRTTTTTEATTTSSSTTTSSTTTSTSTTTTSSTTTTPPTSTP